jgi:hypothetical protein
MLILVDIFDDIPEIFDLDFEDLHANAPNLQYVILDLREVYEHENALTALRNGLDDIILRAPLPDSVRFVVLAPKDKINEVCEVVPRSKATRPLEVIDARDYFRAHTQFQAQRFNPWRWMKVRDIDDVCDYFCLRKCGEMLIDSHRSTTCISQHVSCFMGADSVSLGHLVS